MKRWEAKLSTLCFFKKIKRAERVGLLNEFAKEIQAADGNASEIYGKYREMIMVDYARDWFKIGLLALSFIILCCCAAAPVLFVAECSAEYGFVTYAIHGLYAVQAISILTVLISRKIRIREYKYHWLALAVQLAVTLSWMLFIFYRLADSLSSF